MATSLSFKDLFHFLNSQPIKKIWYKSFRNGKTYTEDELNKYKHIRNVCLRWSGQFQILRLLSLSKAQAQTEFDRLNRWCQPKSYNNDIPALERFFKATLCYGHKFDLRQANQLHGFITELHEMAREVPETTDFLNLFLSQDITDILHLDWIHQEELNELLQALFGGACICTISKYYKHIQSLAMKEAEDIRFAQELEDQRKANIRTLETELSAKRKAYENKVKSILEQHGLMPNVSGYRKDELEKLFRDLAHYAIARDF